MKIKKILLSFLLFSLLLGGECYGQEIDKGQFYISGLTLVNQEGKLHVSMNVDYESLDLPSNESLTFTPILMSKLKNQELSPVIINGKIRQREYHRQQVLGTKQSAKNVPLMVLTDDRQSVHTFTYNTSLSYENWMEDCGLYVRTQGCGCNGEKAEKIIEKLVQPIYISNLKKSEILSTVDRKLLSWVEVLPLTEDYGNNLTVKGTIPFFGGDNLYQKSEAKQNAEIYYRVRSEIRKNLQYNGMSLTGVYLKGYGAPIGNYEKNERKCSERALSLRNYLLENHLAGKNPLEVSWISEDWDSIAQLTASSHMALKDAVLDIINTVDLVKGREKVLMDLNNGTPYKYMSLLIFPRVCRMTYVLKFNKIGLDAQTGKLLIRDRPESMTLGDFFTLGSSYPKGSREFNDVFDLAARLFPRSVEANVNAAAVALLKKDMDKAWKYLEPFATDPKAYNNLGIYYLLQHNKDKAEVYLEMAEAGGALQAKEILDYLRKLQ